MQKISIILFVCILISGCYNCGKDFKKDKHKQEYSKITTHSAFPAKDSSSNSIELSENDSILYSKLSLIWEPNLYVFTQAKKQWNIWNELIPVAYACDPPINYPLPTDSIQFINIKSKSDWNSNYKADSSLNSIFLIPANQYFYLKSSLISSNEYKNYGIGASIKFIPQIAPDSIRKHVFIIDLTLKNGNQYSDTLKPISVLP